MDVSTPCHAATNQSTVSPSWSYATKKTFAKGLLNTALLLSNAAQLKALFALSDSDRDGFWYTQVVLVILSIVLQIVASILLFVLGTKTPCDKVEASKCETMNNAATGLILVITIINIVISGFGMELTNDT